MVVTGILLIAMAAAAVYFQSIIGSIHGESTELAAELAGFKAERARILATKQQRAEFFRKAAFLEQGRQSVRSLTGLLSTLSRITPMRVRLSGLHARWNGQSMDFTIEGRIEGRIRNDLLTVFNRFSRRVERLGAVVDIDFGAPAWPEKTRLEFSFKGIWEE